MHKWHCIWNSNGEIVLDFFDKVKSLSKGYALDYHFKAFKPASLIKLDVMINGEKVDALATISHKDRAYSLGRTLAKKLKELIPKQMFAVAIQAAIGSNIIARETVSAMQRCHRKVLRRGYSRKKSCLRNKKLVKNVWNSLQNSYPTKCIPYCSKSKHK